MAHGFKTGGRTAGTPNWRTSEAAQVIERMEAKLRAEGRLGQDETLDPIEQLALAMIAPEADSAQRLAAAKELAKYLYPQRKAIDVADTTIELTPPISTREAQEQIMAAIEKVKAKRLEKESQ